MARYTQDVTGFVEHNAGRIKTTVRQDGEILDLEGTEAHWLLKESHDEDDDTAILEKSGEEDVDEEEIEYVSTSEGKLAVTIDSEELLGTVDWSSDEVTENQDDIPAKMYVHRLDVTDSEGRLVTGFFGDFEILKR